MDDTKLNAIVTDYMAIHAEAFRIAQRTRPMRQRPRALIVEDQQFSRQLLYGFLVHDFQVDMAEDAQRAVQMFMDFAPDIVFLDIELPGESGHQVANLIKKLDPSVFICMVTVSNASADVTMAINNRVDGFIVKPYTKGRIIECIEKFNHARRIALSKRTSE